MRIPFTALALIAAAAPAAAAEPVAALPDGAAPAAAQDMRRICRASVATGSIMQRKTCRTRAEWARIDRETAEAMGQALDRRPLGGTGGKPGTD